MSVFNLRMRVFSSINLSALLYICIYTMYVYIISRRSITPQHIKYSSKSLDVVQSLYLYIYIYIEIVLHPTTLSYICIYIYVYHFLHAA